MHEKDKKCLYCQGNNKASDTHCQHCGMALPDKHPHSKDSKIKFFVKVFWVIVIFCVVMIFYLPR